MRVLTVQQPWGWAIIYGGKGIENRTGYGRWKYRGPVAIHAGLRWSQRGADFEPLQRAYASWLGFDHWLGYHGGHTAMPIDPKGDERDAELIDFGAVIGVVDMVDAHPAITVSSPGERTMRSCCEPWGEWAYDDARSGKRQLDLVHVVVENPRPIDPILNVRGALGLWKPERVDGLGEEIERRLAA